MKRNRVICSSNLGSNSKDLELDVEILRIKQIKQHCHNLTLPKMKNKITSNSERLTKNAKDSHSRVLPPLLTKIYKPCMINNINHQVA